MVALDATVINIALPTAQRGLHISVTERQWVVTAYTLAFGGLLLLGGRLADSFGRRRTFLIGLAGFASASAAGGAARSFGWLLAARGAQGAFAALLVPTALSLLAVTFVEAHERAKAFAIFGTIAGTGGALGPAARRRPHRVRPVAVVPVYQRPDRPGRPRSRQPRASPTSPARRTAGWTCPGRCWSPAAWSRSSMARPRRLPRVGRRPRPWLRSRSAPSSWSPSWWSRPLPPTPFCPWASRVIATAAAPAWPSACPSSPSTGYSCSSATTSRSSSATRRPKPACPSCPCPPP